MICHIQEEYRFFFFFFFFQKKKLLWPNSSAHIKLKWFISHISTNSAKRFKQKKKIGFWRKSTLNIYRKTVAVLLFEIIFNFLVYFEKKTAVYQMLKKIQIVIILRRLILFKMGKYVSPIGLFKNTKLLFSIEFRVRSALSKYPKLNRCCWSLWIIEDIIGPANG